MPLGTISYVYCVAKPGKGVIYQWQYENWILWHWVAKLGKMACPDLTRKYEFLVLRHKCLITCNLLHNYSVACIPHEENKAHNTEKLGNLFMDLTIWLYKYIKG